MKNLSTVKSDLRKSALKILTFKCCMLKYLVFKKSIWLLIYLEWQPQVWTNHLDIQSPCGQGGTVFSSWVWAEVTILMLNYPSSSKITQISSCNVFQFRFASCWSKSSSVKAHLERRGHGCNWWCWRIYTGPVFNTDPHFNRSTHIQIHLPPHFTLIID